MSAPGELVWHCVQPGCRSTEGEAIRIHLWALGLLARLSRSTLFLPQQTPLSWASFAFLCLCQSPPCLRPPRSSGRKLAELGTKDRQSCVLLFSLRPSPCAVPQVLTQQKVTASLLQCNAVILHASKSSFPHSLPQCWCTTGLGWVRPVTSIHYEVTTEGPCDGRGEDLGKTTQTSLNSAVTCTSHKITS